MSEEENRLIVPDPDNREPELVPVVAAGHLAPVQPPADTGQSGVALGGLLDDALFGEVIDISDILPLSGPDEASPSWEMASALPDQPVADTAVLETGVSITILYDDDILAPDGGIL